MELPLEIIIDELSCYNVKEIKVSSDNSRFRFAQLYNPNINMCLDPSLLYMLDSNISKIKSSLKWPKHVLVLGHDVPEGLLKCADTIIQINQKICLEELFQKIVNVFISYQNWNESLNLAIIQHKSISEFLDIAAKKLTNPIALFDNSLTVLATAGEFKKTYIGTIWEKINNPSYIIADFFTLQEKHYLSTMTANNIETPYVYRPVFDREHTYVSSHIWINDKLYGNLGLVDVNSPITDGQLSIIHHITKSLRLYFLNNDVYMHIANNSTSFIENLLKEVSVDEKIITFHLKKLGWCIHDEFYVLNFSCPLPLNSPIEANAYIKHLNQCFPHSLITVYESSILMILRNSDFPIEECNERQKLENLLIKNEMKCGISSCFSDFTKIKIYYVQSAFALQYCKLHTNNCIQYYKNCHEQHLIELLNNSVDLRCLCHPKILALWNNKKDNHLELIDCLYQYLLNGRNLAMTSNSLHIHRNTLVYRINKISNLLGVDLKNISTDQLLYLLFSCMLVHHI